jgi:glycerol kinase
MEKDSGVALSELRADGGASVNNRLMQFQADAIGVKVVRPQVAETTALGAAYLAGLATGVWDGYDDVAAHWQLDRAFIPSMSSEERDARYTKWQMAVQRSLAWEQPE